MDMEPAHAQPESSAPLAKAVSFGSNGGGAEPSPPDEKLLSRKPTPFNQELSAEIRRSGLGATFPDDATNGSAPGPSSFATAAAAAAAFVNKRPPARAPAE
jgi:hypothetical protein